MDSTVSSPNAPVDEELKTFELDSVSTPLEQSHAVEDVVTDEEAEEIGRKFIATITRLKGVRIDRESFLRSELEKAFIPEDKIDEVINSTPAQAGIDTRLIDKLAKSTIEFETRKSSAISFAAGLPGGFGMIATIPADVTQYYVHAFRVMQKLAYLYGWQSFISDLNEKDDETVAKFAIFLGVMLGVGGAANNLMKFANDIARPAVQRNIAKKALTKTFYYGPIKKTLRFIGVKVTKDSFAKGVAKAVPLAGGIISGSLTYASLKSQSGQLQKHLKGLPLAWPEGKVPEEFTLDEDEPKTSKKEQAKQIIGSAKGKLPLSLKNRKKS
ncbi:hypothetical protein [Rothia nasisuis]|uniref:hypothetical protein n=1 Tax=Rothia nasisuis TaxID=2109647 RepID=UPI001F42369D|nr:hypothetical protein [Rothia nasisuis]